MISTKLLLLTTLPLSFHFSVILIKYFRAFFTTTFEILKFNYHLSLSIRNTSILICESFHRSQMGASEERLTFINERNLKEYKKRQIVGWCTIRVPSVFNVRNRKWTVFSLSECVHLERKTSACLATYIKDCPPNQHLLIFWTVLKWIKNSIIVG